MIPLAQGTGDDARLRQAPWSLWGYHRHYGYIRGKVTVGMRMLLSTAIFDKSCTYQRELVAGRFLSWLGYGCGQWCFGFVSFLSNYTKFDVIRTSVLGSNGNCLVLRKSGPLTQLLDCKTSADISRMPASAGLSLEATWFHSSTQVYSKISHTRFATNIGCLLVELSHFKTVELPVHIKTLLTCTVSARQISCFNRAASSAACNSSFGIVITFIGATRALSRTNASPVFGTLELFTWARRIATAWRPLGNYRQTCVVPGVQIFPQNSSLV